MSELASNSHKDKAQLFRQRTYSQKSYLRGFLGESNTTRLVSLLIGPEISISGLDHPAVACLPIFLAVSLGFALLFDGFELGPALVERGHFVFGFLQGGDSLCDNAFVFLIKFGIGQQAA